MRTSFCFGFMKYTRLHKHFAKNLMNNVNSRMTEGHAMMSVQHGNAPIVPDIDATRRIDIVSRRFEADWRADKSPAIGDYLPMNSPAWCVV
jgi:hypothetical protein